MNGLRFCSTQNNENLVNESDHTLVEYEISKWTLADKDSTVLFLIYNVLGLAKYLKI